MGISASVSEVSCATSVATQHAAVKNEGVSVVNVMSKAELIKALDMNENYCVRGSMSDKGIITAFGKYQEINKAYTRLQNSKDWPGKKPLRLTIIELCMSKSQFYDDCKPLFGEAVKYSEMVEWLNQEEGCLSGFELFGVEKAFYTMADLERWLERKKTKAKAKGKAKEEKEKKGKSGGSDKRAHKKQ